MTLFWDPGPFRIASSSASREDTLVLLRVLSKSSTLKHAPLRHTVADGSETSTWDRVRALSCSSRDRLRPSLSSSVGSRADFSRERWQQHWRSRRSWDRTCTVLGLCESAGVEHWATLDPNSCATLLNGLSGLLPGWLPLPSCLFR